MSFDLSSIQRSVQLPPRIVLYGVPGIGKTTFAASMPDPVFLPVEDGLGELEVPAFPRPTTWSELMLAISTLYESDHDYKTLVIDSLDRLEPIVWDHVAQAHGKKSIEDFGYGKGYTAALAEWRELLEALDALREMKGMTICCVAHSQIVKFEAPDADPYDRYQMRLHKTAAGAICDWADAILFANYEVHVVQKSDSDKRRGVGKGERSLFTTERPAFVAKNRYRMDDELPMEWDAVSPFLFKKPAPKQRKTKKAKEAQDA